MDIKFLSSDLLKSEKLTSASWAFIFGGFIYQLLYIFQGIDFTDTGFHLTSYQLIFDHPETVHYSFMFWLSNIAGGLWMKIFSGLFANRIASVVLHSFMFWLYYNLLKHISGKNKAVLYCFFSLFFFQYFGFETLNYDSFSIVSMSTSLYFLVKGLWDKRLAQLILGAFICGASTYFRITNFAYAAFIPLTILYYYLINKDHTKTVSTGALISFAYVCGHLAVIGIMVLIGHWELFRSNIEFVKEMGSAGDSSHGLVSVMLLYIKGWVKIGLFVSFLILLYFLRPLVKSFISFDLMKGLLLFGFGFAMFFVYQNPTSTWSKLRYFLYAGIFINSIFLIWKGERQLSILCIFSFVLMILFPLGSDSGIEKHYFSCGLSLSLLFYTINQSLNDEKWIPFKNMGVILFITTCLCFGYSNTYFDLGSRIDKTATTSQPGLSHIYTTIERATEIDTLIAELGKTITKGDYLLAFSDIPMVNYLTETLPCIGTSWPKLYYAPAIFEKELEKAFEEHGAVTIILQKMEMRSAWPKNDTPTYLDLGLTEDGKHPKNRLPEHYQIMFDFLENNGYDQVWENETFRIYKMLRN